MTYEVHISEVHISASYVLHRLFNILPFGEATILEGVEGINGYVS